MSSTLTIHLGLMRLPASSEQRALLLQAATASERQHAEAFRSQKRRDEYLAGRWLGRAMAAEIIGGDAEDYAIARTEAGPPCLQHANGAAIADTLISISHSRDWLVCALTNNAANSLLGVDIESLNRSVRALAVAEHSFASTEADYLATLSASAQQRAFTELWTLKEASLKAAGIGIARGLRRPTFAALNDAAWSCIEGIEDKPMAHMLISCVTGDDDESFCLALATNKLAFTLNILIASGCRNERIAVSPNRQLQQSASGSLKAHVIDLRKAV